MTATKIVGTVLVLCLPLLAFDIRTKNQIINPIGLFFLKKKISFLSLAEQQTKMALIRKKRRRRRRERSRKNCIALLVAVKKGVADRFK